MKWSKFIIIIPILFLTTQIYYYYYSKDHSATLNPISVDNSSLALLSDQFRLSQINPLNFQVFNYRHEVEFFVNRSNHPIKVIISLQTDTLSQINALQKLLRNDKITSDINLIDLSSRPAYATFQNF